MTVRSYVQAIVSPRLADKDLRSWANAVTLVRTVVGLFRLECLILDSYFSNQFLRWSNLSPNCFYVVDRAVGWLNWSQLTFFNLGMVTILPLATRSIWAAAPVLMALSSAKLYSAAKHHRMPLPEG